MWTGLPPLLMEHTNNGGILRIALLAGIRADGGMLRYRSWTIAVRGGLYCRQDRQGRPLRIYQQVVR